MEFFKTKVGFAWNLKFRFFSRLDSKFFETVKKLENSLKKYYVIRCIQNNRKEKCKEFFERNAEELSKDKEWRDWFVLPFLNNPELHPELEPYMNKRWEEMLSISMHNFISTVIISIEKPELLVIYSENHQGKSSIQRKKMDTLQIQNENLKKELLSSENNFKKLKKKIDSKQESPTMKCKTISLKSSLNGHTKRVTKCSFLGSFLVTGSDDQTIRLWNFKSESCLSVYHCSSEITCIGFFEKKEPLILCGLNTNIVKILSIENSQLKQMGEIVIQEKLAVIQSICSTINYSRVVISYYVGSNGYLTLFNLNEMKMEHSFVLPENLIVNSVNFNHNGTMIVVGNSNGMIQIYGISL